MRWNLKLLHRIIITPEFHHWHHTNEKDAKYRIAEDALKVSFDKKGGKNATNKILQIQS